MIDPENEMTPIERTIRAWEAMPPSFPASLPPVTDEELLEYMRKKFTEKTGNRSALDVEIHLLQLSIEHLEKSIKSK